MKEEVSVVACESGALDQRTLMRADELAEYLGVPLGTIYAWNHRRRGPRALKVGRHLRFRRTDVESWLDGLAA